MNFRFLKLTAAQCKYLTDQYHIYLPGNGRINMSGLNSKNVSLVARAIDEVVRAEADTRLSSKLA